MIAPPVWNAAYPGPEALIATAPMDPDMTPFCTYVPDDGTYGERNSTLIWSSIDDAYEETGDALFFTRASQILGGAVEIRIEDTLMEGVGNRATLLGLLRNLQGP
jgi:hypothetical protein